MNKAKMVNEYLEWRQLRENQLRYYIEDEVSAESWIKDMLMSESHAKMNMLHKLLEDPELAPEEFAVKAMEIIQTPLEELISGQEEELDDPTSVGASGEAQSLGQEESSWKSLLEGA